MHDREEKYYADGEDAYDMRRWFTAAGEAKGKKADKAGAAEDKAGEGSKAPEGGKAGEEKAAAEGSPAAGDKKKPSRRR